MVAYSFVFLKENFIRFYDRINVKVLFPVFIGNHVSSTNSFSLNNWDEILRPCSVCLISNRGGKASLFYRELKSLLEELGTGDRLASRWPGRMRTKK